MNSEVRFYFDADVLGLAHIICGLRLDCTYPGDPGIRIKRRERPPCLITSPHKVNDRDWIQTASSQGWIAITRDSNILDHLTLLLAVRETSLRLVTISGPEGKYKWDQLEIFMTQWRRIEALKDREGPLIMSVTRTTMRQIDIDGRLTQLGSRDL